MSFNNVDGIIEVNGLDLMSTFGRFHSFKAEEFLNGLVLADDLKRENSGLVLSKGTELTHDRFRRLLNMRESNSKVDFVFRLQRTDILLAIFRKEILERVNILYDRRMKSKMFCDMAMRVRDGLIPAFELALGNPNILMAVQQMRFCCEISGMKKSILYSDLGLNMALFALSLANSPQLRESFGGKPEKVTPLLQASLLHNIGAVQRLGMLAELPDTERPQAYWNTALEGVRLLRGVDPGAEVLSLVDSLFGYQQGKMDFVAKQDAKSIAANILVAVEYFQRRESGMFGDATEARQIVDRMNVMSYEHSLNDKVAQALTLSLNLKDIFDFYVEMDRLIGECPYNSAAAYPMTGFRSPTLYICRNKVTRCRYLELTLSAVKLVLKSGDLPAGDYHRCKLLTPRLMKFYAEYYEEIKEETAGQKSKPEEADHVPPPTVIEKAPVAPNPNAPFEDKLTELFSQGKSKTEATPQETKTADAKKS